MNCDEIPPNVTRMSSGLGLNEQDEQTAAQGITQDSDGISPNGAWLADVDGTRICALLLAK